jgi:hypothetical protein
MPETSSTAITERGNPDAGTPPTCPSDLDTDTNHLKAEHVGLQSGPVKSTARDENADAADLRVTLIGQKTESRKRDWWDKVDIIAKLLSSVLLAAVALLINSSIQRSQIASAEANTRAQMDAARNKAQDDKKIQEGALTAQLVQHLASKDPIEREISIIALRESVPQQIYGAALLVLARSDPNKDVRLRAIENLPASPSAPITNALSNIAADATRSSEERKAAEVSTQKAAVGQFLTGSGEIVFAAASPNTLAFDGDPNVGHGVFTHFLLTGLSGAADTNRDGVVDSAELQQYLADTVSNFTQGKQKPYVTSTAPGVLPLNKPLTASGKIVMLGIGLSKYQDPALAPLRYPLKDVQAVTDWYKTKTSSVTVLTDTTRQNILSSIELATQGLGTDDTLIIYYSGHGTLLDGKPMLVPYDAMVSAPSSLLSVDDLKSLLRDVKAIKVLYLDTCFT